MLKVQLTNHMGDQFFAKLLEGSEAPQIDGFLTFQTEQGVLYRNKEIINEMLVIE